MTSQACKYPMCPTYVPAGTGFCAAHAEFAPVQPTNQFYDQHKRDQEAKRFYDSAAWQRARHIRLVAYPVCELCERAWSTTVHHRIPLADCTPEQRTEQDNLQACCSPCHSAVEAERRRIASCT